MKAYVDFNSAKVAGLVTLSEYITSRTAALRLNPEKEGRRFYQIIVSLVLDNPFSLEAKKTFPMVEGAFDIPHLAAWAWNMKHNWLAHLPRRDAKLYNSLQFKA